MPNPHPTRLGIPPAVLALGVNGVFLLITALVHINLLVDIYNLISPETRLSLVAHDITRAEGDIHLRPIGASEPKPPRAGGYAYIDDANDAICMLESRQVEKAKITLTSTDVFFIVQGNPAVSEDLLVRAARRLVEPVQNIAADRSRSSTRRAWLSDPSPDRKPDRSLETCQVWLLRVTLLSNL